MLLCHVDTSDGPVFKRITEAGALTCGRSTTVIGPGGGLAEPSTTGLRRLRRYVHPSRRMNNRDAQTGTVV